VTSTFGIVRVGNILDKRVDLVDWVGIVVVALAVADGRSRTWKHCFVVVVPVGFNQQDNFPEQFVLSTTCSFCFRLVLNLLQGLVLLWFGFVNLLRCGWAFCPSHFAPTVRWGPPRNAKLNKH